MGQAIIEICTRLVAANNEVRLLWVPAHKGVAGNEFADGLAKEAAGGPSHSVQDEIRWKTSPLHLSRRVTENRTGEAPSGSPPMCEGTAPPGRTGFRGKQLRRVHKSIASRYYQLPLGHAAIGSFLHDRMTGAQRADSGECWWCNCGKR